MLYCNICTFIAYSLLTLLLCAYKMLSDPLSLYAYSMGISITYTSTLQCKLLINYSSVTYGTGLEEGLFNW